MANPLSSQCTAMSKRSGCRCQRMVVGGGVCAIHGGTAPQVKAAREARIVVMEAELEAARRELPYERRHPGQVLLDAVMASDVLLQHLLRKHAAGELTPEESTALGWAIDRATRTSKTALDASVEARLAELEDRHVTAEAGELAGLVTGLFGYTLRVSSLSAKDKLRTWFAWFDGLQQFREEAEQSTEAVEFPQLRGAEVREFQRELESAAAAEREQSGGIGWGDDSESDFDDVPLLFSGDGAVA